MPSSSTLPPCSYTVVITSCRRFDLLRPSILTLKANLDVAPKKWIIVEDSDDQRVRDCVKDLGIDATVIVNGKQLGQIASIDRAYAEVDTPYVFHSEDDWEFYRKGFIQESLAILEAHPKLSMVGLRARSDQNPLVRNMPMLSQDGIGYFVLDPALHPEYFSYCFNPGLRRMSDYRDVGPFSKHGPEADVSYAFKQHGFAIANLEADAVRHIGDGRHVHDPTQPPKAKSLPQKLMRSFRKRWKRLQRLLGSSTS
jgi:hypothetical protein